MINADLLPYVLMYTKCGAPRQEAALFKLLVKTPVHIYAKCGALCQQAAHIVLGNPPVHMYAKCSLSCDLTH